MKLDLSNDSQEENPHNIGMKVHAQIKGTGQNMTPNPFLSKDDVIEFCRYYQIPLNQVILIYV